MEHIRNKLEQVSNYNKNFLWYNNIMKKYR